MKRIGSALLFASLLLIISGQKQAWAWRSTLYPQNWSAGYSDSQGRSLPDFSYAGYHRGEEPIPDISGPIFNVVDYGANPNDQNDDTNAIQTAINAAQNAGSGVVYFPAGTYFVTPKEHNWALLITESNIILRGSDQGQSRIFFNSTVSRGGGIIRIDPWPGPERRNLPGWWEDRAFDFKFGDWQEDDRYTGKKVAVNLNGENILPATKIIPVADPTEFTPGDQVIVKARKTEAFLNDLNNPNWGENQIRGLMYQREIMAVDEANKTITIDIPTRYPIKASYNPVVYKILEPIKEVGIENLFFAMLENPNINNPQSDSNEQDNEIHNSRVIFFRNSLNSWVRNVNTYSPPQNNHGYGYYTERIPDSLKEELGFNIHSYGIIIRDSRNITVENCHFKNPQTHGEGGNGYMFVLYGNDLLIKNSSAINARHNFDFKGMEANGSVIYNSIAGFSPHYPDSDSEVYGKTLQSDFHMWFSHANLIDNLTLDGDSFSAQYRAFGIHKVAAAGNVFWNTKITRTHIRRGGGIISDQWGWGYVIGMRGPEQKLTIYGAANPGDPHRPDFYEPASIMEGNGQGETLEPQSLYLDQLARRLGPQPTPTITPIATATPACAGPADVNCDQTVNSQDAIEVLKNWLLSSPYPAGADVNDDLKVNGIDFGYVLNDWTD